MIEEITSPEERKVAKMKKKGTGIKALVTVGDLSSIIAAAKKWQAHVVEQGGDASKLLHHIANAEAVCVKCVRRNKLAFDRRQRKREAEEAETFVPPTIPNQEAKPESPSLPSLLGNIGKALDKALGRPTKW